MTKLRPQLSESAIRSLLALKHDEITQDWLKRKFGYVDGKQSIPFDGEFTLRAADIETLPIPKFSGSSIVTTAGRYVANYFLFGNAKFTPLLQYVNEPFSKKVFGKVEKQIIIFMTEGNISSLDYVDYTNRKVWFTYSITDFVAPPLTNNFYRITPSLKALKSKLLAENAEAIAKVDMTVCGSIDKAVNEEYKRGIESDPCKDYLDSGAAKNVAGVTVAMRGLMGESKNPKKFNFIPTSLQEGINKDEIAKYADIGISGACGRGLDTQKGGYLVKRYNAAFSYMELDEPHTDCGTSHYRTVTLNDNSLDEYHLRYVIFEGKEILLTKANIDKLKGKTVKMRSPMFCTGDKICNKCAGELYYKLGSTRVGFLMSRIGSNLLNSSLKSFHESTVNIKKIEISNYLKKLE